LQPVCFGSSGVVGAIRLTTSELAALHTVFKGAKVFAVVIGLRGAGPGGLAIQLLDLVQRQPAGDDHIGPAVRVVALGIRVWNHVQRVQGVHPDLPLDVRVEVHAHIKVAALLDQTIAEYLRLLPVQIGHVGHLHGHLAQDCRLGQIGVTAPWLERNVHAVVDLVPHCAVHTGLDLVELVRRPLLQVKPGPVLGQPLATHAEVHILASGGLGQVVNVPAFFAVFVPFPVLARGIVAKGVECCHG